MDTLIHNALLIHNPNAGNGGNGRRRLIDQARKIGQELPLLAVHAAVLEACVRHGESEKDNSIVIEEIKRRAHDKAS